MEQGKGERNGIPGDTDLSVLGGTDLMHRFVKTQAAEMGSSWRHRSGRFCRPDLSQTSVIAQEMGKAVPGGTALAVPGDTHLLQRFVDRR